MYVLKVKHSDLYIKLLEDWEYDVVTIEDATEWVSESQLNRQVYAYAEESSALYVETEIVER